MFCSTKCFSNQIDQWRWLIDRIKKFKDLGLTSSGNIITSGNISPNTPRSGSKNDKNASHLRRFMDFAFRGHLFLISAMSKHHFYCILVLGKPYKKLRVQKEPNKRYYEPGSNVKLTCDVGNATFYALTWGKRTFGGYFYALKSNFKGFGNLTLEVNSLKAHDLGTYTCAVLPSPHNWYTLSLTIEFKGTVQL